MKVYFLKFKQFIPSNLETVWNFFSTPINLDKITPTEMNMEILNITGGSAMYAGQLIVHKVEPFPFLRMVWVTEIKQVSYQKYFIDEQKSGPFALWTHQHFFFQKENGVEMVDEVSYALPFGLLGRVANIWFVKQRVVAIFQYRKSAIENIFKQTETIIV